MKNYLNGLENFLENVDSYRDRFLFLFIKPYWPRKITPNHVTWVRVFLGILLFVLLFWFGIENKILIILLFLIGAITDFVDGPVARGTDRVTEFGAMLDSTADRILIIPIAVYGLFFEHKWLLLSLILVEILNAIVSLFYKSKEVYLKSNIFGKTKMVLMCIVFAVILIVWPKSPSPFFIDILWVSIIFSFLSMFSKTLELNSQGHIKNKTIAGQLKKYEK
jgi:phosphatidylglycerophosphate synthase